MSVYQLVLESVGNLEAIASSICFDDNFQLQLDNTALAKERDKHTHDRIQCMNIRKHAYFLSH